MKRSFLTCNPRNRAVRMRHLRRRLSLDNGVVRITFVKVLSPAVQLPTCRECGGYVLSTETICAGCWARSLTPPSPPWEGPKCCIMGCPVTGKRTIYGAWYCEGHAQAVDDGLCCHEGCVHERKYGYIWCAEHLPSPEGGAA